MPPRDAQPPRIKTAQTNKQLPWKQSSQAHSSPSASRLDVAGLYPGGTNIPATESAARARFRNQDTRVRLSLSPGARNILYKDPTNALLGPLLQTNGLIWPYTPTINVTYSANYTGAALPHTNYMYHSYNNSQIDQIQVVGEFTANTPEEASYVLAALHFLRSVTKMYYGQDSQRGMPPPILRFSGHGQYMFNSVPVAVQNITQDFEPNVDYIEAPVYVDQGRQTVLESVTKIPSQIMVNATLVPIVSRTRSLDFSFEEYARGGLIGNKDGLGGLP